MYIKLLWALLPEILLAAFLVMILLLDTIGSKRLVLPNYILAITAMLVAATLSAIPYHTSNFSALGLIFDKSTGWTKVALCVVSCMVFAYGKNYMQARKLFTAEYFLLYLFALLGMMLLISSNNFLTMYISLELFSLPLYALIAIYSTRQHVVEAALKYYLLGAIASGFLLYGISLYYGVTGSIQFSPSAVPLAASVVFKLSLLLTLFGLLFKLGLVPLHMWLPVVYEGAPTNAGVFIATAPKIAVIVAVHRLLTGPYLSLFADWQQLLVFLAIISIGFGNLLAVVQDNLKRMLAYSTIANIGFAILALASGQPQALALALFYIIAYALMCSGVFASMLILSSPELEFVNLQDFSGLAKRQPLIAIVLLFCMFSIVGLPPLLGFFSKFMILTSIISAGYVWLAGLALVFSVIGVLYCLRLVNIMFFSDSQPVLENSHTSVAGKIMLGLNGIGVLLLGCVFLLNCWDYWEGEGGCLLWLKM